MGILKRETWIILFIDSDILLDILLIRQPNFEDSVSIVSMQSEYEIQFFTTPQLY
jgi:hypothetical protein